jgi:hypothetical protein
MTVQSMTLGVFKLDSSTGTGTTGDLTDYSDDVLSMSAGIPEDNGKYHTIDSPWQKVLDGAKSFPITLTVPVDTAADSLYTILMDWKMAAAPGVRQFEAYTPDASAGSQKYAGSCGIGAISNAFNVQGGSGEVQAVNVTLNSHGAVTRSTVSS